MNEPATLITDYLLAALGPVLADRAARSLPPLPRPGQLWAASFVALAAAAVAGGTWHGIHPDTLPTLRHHLWSITYVMIGLADSLILAGAAWAALPRGPRALALLLLLGRFGVYAVLILRYREFRFAGYDYLATLLLLLVFGFDLARRRAPAAGFVIVGVLVSGLGAVVQAQRLAPHPHFNHNDLFHVIQMAGVWLFYRAALLLDDREPSAGL